MATGLVSPSAFWIHGTSVSSAAGGRDLGWNLDQVSFTMGEERVEFRGFNKAVRNQRRLEPLDSFWSAQDSFRSVGGHLTVI